jgi:hypothetical protein
MKHLIEIAQENGFVFTYGNSIKNISTMGDIRVRLDKEDKHIVWGLNENGRPPTLCYPRPQIRLKTIVNNQVVVLSQNYDSAVNYLLSQVPHEEIFKSLFDPDFIFHFDLTKNP